MDRDQIKALHQLLAIGKPEWGAQATYAALSRIAGTKHRIAWQLALVAIGLACDDPMVTGPGDLAKMDAPHWHKARQVLATGDDGRRYANAHARKVLTEAARSRQEFSLEDHARGAAAARRALMAAQARRDEDLVPAG